MEKLFLTVESFLYFINLQVIMPKIMGYREKRIFFIFAGVLLHLLLSLAAFWGDITVFILLHTIVQVMQIVIAKFIWKKSNLFTVIGFYLLMYCSISIVTILVECIFLLSNYYSQIAEFIIHGVCSLVCVIGCFNRKISSNVKHIVNALPSKTKVVLTAFIVTNTWFMSLVLSISATYENVYYDVLLRFSIISISAVLFVVFPVIIITILSNLYLKSQNELFQKDIEAQAKHYSDLAKANYELRRFKHDFNNIKIGLTRVLQDHDCLSALNILEGAEYDMRQNAEAALAFDTGNGIVDAILTEKQEQAESHHTKIMFSGSVPPNAIAPTDLCVLFGNTLDNAIEACERIHSNGEKTIVISCLCNSGFMFLSVANPVTENVEIHGNTVATSKKDKAMHGYGLYSLNKTVQHLDGTLSLSCENKIFKVEIDISLQGTSVCA